VAEARTQNRVRSSRQEDSPTPLRSISTVARPGVLVTVSVSPGARGAPTSHTAPQAMPVDRASTAAAEPSEE